VESAVLDGAANADEMTAVLAVSIRER
jgi:hypothetical protein